VPPPAEESNDLDAFPPAAQPAETAPAETAPAGTAASNPTQGAGAPEPDA
jgi:hypothetical protein